MELEKNLETVEKLGGWVISVLPKMVSMRPASFSAMKISERCTARYLKPSPGTSLTNNAPVPKAPRDR